MSIRPLLLSVALFGFGSPLWAATKVDLDYNVRFVPEDDVAEVSMTLDKGEAIQRLSFNLGDEQRYSDFSTEGGEWTQESPERGIWTPGKGKTKLSYRVKISHPRADGKFDALMTRDWALFRGDNLIPSAAMQIQDKTNLVAHLKFKLPEGWPSVETGWPRVGKNTFRINNPQRKFDRPTGWILAGKIGTRRTKLGETDVTIAAPDGQGMRRMDMLTMLTYVWPEAQAVFPRDPKKLLVVGANDPMWRGGLSASNSYFMHAGRPTVSENGTSSLVHELVHVFTRIKDTDKSDWISEGLAEYYAIELVRRSGGMTEERYQKVREQLLKWSKSVKTLRTENSTGPITARAVLMLQDLDREIRKATNDRKQLSLDDVTRGLMRLDKVSTKDFIQISENVMGKSSDVLDTKLLKSK
ncbi:hypothetical protein [Pseudomonas sp. S9]|uniref:hypothetical protein n=1 Tax=Pseudomonas sp. S9 TaxID=686578 RepID=UPI0002557090|nr:hypothetical protein [Pseudomonas sp. S9]